MQHSVNVLVWAKKISSNQEVIIANSVFSFNVFDQINSGIEEFKKNHFDIALVFLDDFKDFALSAIQQIKKENKNLPVIVVLSSDTQKVEFEAAGATTCLTFDEFNQGTLKLAIDFSLKISEAARQLKDAKNQLKKLENRLSTIIGNTPMILFMLDTKGVFKLGLGKLWEQFKIQKQFVLGQNIYELYKLYPDFISIYEAALEGGTQKCNVSINDIVFEIILTPVKDSKNEVKEILGVAHDITERVKGESSLLKAKKIAEDTAKIKQEFIANMSHEIRTPMNAIVGFSNLLEETPLNKVQQDYVHSIRLSGENLLNLINSILDFSVIESGKAKLDNELFELQQVLNSVEKVLFLNIKKKKIAFEFNVAEDVPGELVGDPNRLYQILVNLLGNSVKFTEKGKISLKVTVAHRKNNDLILEFLIEDTGIGIPDYMLDKVFDSFTQVNPESTRKHGGAGLGLSIVKNIITQLHGKIHLESQLGKGTTFRVNIPFKVMENNLLKEVGNSNTVNFESELKGLKILLAEDNSMNQKLVIMILRKFDLRIDLAENGLEALKALKANDYDLILMDIQMPEMDGIEATKIIRKDFPENKKNIPIIALTAHAFQDELDKCIEVGMNSYIIKPINTEDFLLTIIQTKTKSNSQLVMDLSYLKSLSAGDDQMLRDIIQTYQSEMPEILHELQHCFQKGDLQQTSRMAHKAKSSFKMLGMERAVEALLEIEKLAKENKAVGMQEQIDRVNHQFEMAMKKLLVS